MSNIAQLLEAGLKSHRAGDLQTAAAAYREVLAADPRHAETLHLLGMVAVQSGQHQVAAQHLGEAIGLEPNRAAYHALLAEAYRGLGQWNAAVASYRRAIELEPLNVDAHCNLGTVWQTVGNLDEAEACYRAALALAPTHALAHGNLGSLLQSRGDAAGAEAQFRAALAANADDLDARIGLGHALREQGKRDESLACFEALVHVKGDSVAARHGLACAYQSLGRHDEAAAEYRRVIGLAPDYLPAYTNLATILRERDEDAEAIACYREVLRISPNYVDGYLSLSATYTSISMPDEAASAARGALAVDPASAQAHSHLANALMFQGELDGAIAEFRRVVELKPDDAAEHSNLLYMLNAHPDSTPASLFAEHRQWAARHAEPLTARAAMPANDRRPERRLRVGYVSSHFRDHAVSLFSEPLLAAHDHGQFEVFCYSDVRKADPFTERFQAIADQWRPIAGLSDEQVAALVRQDQIDILVDLAGHIGGNRLLVFARRAAPVQVTYLGYQNTTGMSAMDYRLSDAHADPAGQTDAFHSEQLIRLPRSFFCYRLPHAAPELNALPASATGRVTFASMNNTFKITPAVLGVWAEILAAVPDSRLRVLAYPGGVFERNVRAIMGERGVGGERLEFLNKRPRYEYLQLHHQHDVALDTFPFNGHTTACDALWMGVPSVMMVGDRYASRFGSSALVNLGLNDLVARSPAEYVAAAVQLAGDLPRLVALRRALRGQMQQSVVCDAAGFARHVEEAYRRMWRQWCQQ